MKLATLGDGSRDGILAVVDNGLTRIAPAAHIAPTLQAALEDWAHLAPRLEALSHALNGGAAEGQPLDVAALASPLPRGYQWLDGSAYLSHVERVRHARGAVMPPEFEVDPLMYQGNSACFLGPREPMMIADQSWDLDLEGEIAVVTDDVSRGVTPSEARAHIRLLMLCNDVSLRGLIPAELAKGFGFLQGKPGPAFAPVAVTPDELGMDWDGGRLALTLTIRINGAPFGRLDAGEGMQFDFPTLIAHAAKTRRLPAGTVLGSGTVSNHDAGNGFACIAEKRCLEVLEHGHPITPYLRSGDRVCIEVFDRRGQSVFGAIDQVVQMCLA